VSGAKVLKKSEFQVGCFMLPQVIFHGPEVCLAMGYPEDHKLCIGRGIFLKSFTQDRSL